MNLLEILRSRVNGLQEGDYLLGLKAVLQHIEVAGRHHARGQVDADETAFTDAIYRTNQAFEGSLKEAFRVLAAKDPSGETPFNIENYLQQQNVLRPRVLAQLTNYRREWRNPSTHDYRLDFDEDEALLAIVTVSAFAIVLTDQITERISFEQAKSVAATEQPAATPIEQPLLEKVSTLLKQFAIQFDQLHAGKHEIREVELVGGLAGYLAAAAPELQTQTEAELSPVKSARADFIIAGNGERLIVEVKRGRSHSRKLLEDGTQQLMAYMEVSGISQGILFQYYWPNTGNVKHLIQPLLLGDGQIAIITIT